MRMILRETERGITRNKISLIMYTTFKKYLILLHLRGTRVQLIIKSTLLIYIWTLWMLLTRNTDDTSRKRF
jgi:hypothetical protein